MKKYCIVDFQGYVCWCKLPNGRYAVDRQSVDKFKAIFADAIEVSRC